MSRARFDETGLGEPAVWSEQGWYWMLYTARDRKEYGDWGSRVRAMGCIGRRVSEQPVLAGAHPGIRLWSAIRTCLRTDPACVCTSEGERSRNRRRTWMDRSGTLR